MDNLMLNRDEMQDEELYALLDRALGAEQICVSEDLIQKTLKRVAEAEESKVVSIETARKRRLPAMKYISVAVAALFVAVLGIGVMRNGSFSKDSMEMEATYDNASRKAEGVLADSPDGMGLSVVENKDDAPGVQFDYSSTNGVGDMSDIDDAMPESNGTIAQEDRGGMPKASEETESVLESTSELISAKVTEALAGVGMTPISGSAEYWEFVQSGFAWEEELFRHVAAMQTFDEPLPQRGDYSYCLVCGDGSRQTVSCGYPLDGIVRIETNKGVIWGLLGEEVRFYAE